jgi:hypothetical protein
VIKQYVYFGVIFGVAYLMVYITFPFINAPSARSHSQQIIETILAPAFLTDHVQKVLLTPCTDFFVHGQRNSEASCRNAELISFMLQAAWTLAVGAFAGFFVKYLIDILFLKRAHRTDT